MWAGWGLGKRLTDIYRHTFWHIKIWMSSECTERLVWFIEYGTVGTVRWCVGLATHKYTTWVDSLLGPRKMHWNSTYVPKNSSRQQYTGVGSGGFMGGLGGLEPPPNLLWPPHPPPPRTMLGRYKISLMSSYIVVRPHMCCVKGTMKRRKSRNSKFIWPTE